MPDFLMPVQYAGLRTSVGHDSGEKRLVFAVLEDAINTALAAGGRRGRRMDECWAWIEQEGDAPFSFDWCCEHLRLDASCLRQKLLERCHDQQSTPREAPGPHGARVRSSARALQLAAPERPEEKRQEPCVPSVLEYADEEVVPGAFERDAGLSPAVQLAPADG